MLKTAALELMVEKGVSRVNLDDLELSEWIS